MIDDHIQEPLNEVDHDVTSGDIWVVLVAAIGHAIVALFGDVLYTGVVARAVVSVRHDDHRSLWEITRTLPYLRLAAADVLLAVCVGVGIVLLIIPGLIFLAWFALIAPAIELEERRVFAAFKRSRELVRGNVLRVMVLLVPLLLLDDLLSSLVQSKELLGIHSGFFVDWAAAVFADMLTTPLYALAIVIAFFQLRDGPGVGTTT